MLPLIDGHVHCRDEDLSYKSKISDVAYLERKNRISVFIDMPNNKPVTIHKENVETRIGLSELENCSKGYYLNIGLTKEPAQIREAAEIATSHPRVCGAKYFTTGKEDDVLAIKSEKEQRKMIRVLADFGYRGVLIPHCEKESLFNKGKFNPEKPWTWDDERPEEAEAAAIRDQIRFARKVGFVGHIHFPHVSTPLSFDEIEKGYYEDVNVSAEVTPHHLLLSKEDMHSENGLMLKANSPIRGLETVKALWKRLEELMLENVIPVSFGSDHAPHKLEEKMKYPYASGLQSLHLFKNLLNTMENRGFTQGMIDNFTYYNAKKIFPKIKE